MLRPALLALGSIFPLFCGTTTAASAAGRGEPVPTKIVSTNLCTDQYLLALADRNQIAGLTVNARDPDMSAAAARARGLPLLRGSTEEVLARDPDLILSVSEDTGRRLSSLTGRPYRTLTVPSAHSYADIMVQIRMVAGAVGHPHRGEALIRRMDAHLAEIAPRAGRRQVAAYYQRRGYLTGSGTLVDDLMRRVGLENLADRLGRPVLSQLSLEQIVVAQPDYLIIESATDRVPDKGTEMLRHPALANIRRLYVAEAWTVCGGPAYVRAARSLAEQMARQR